MAHVNMWTCENGRYSQNFVKPSIYLHFAVTWPKKYYLINAQRGVKEVLIYLFHPINEEASDLSPMPCPPPPPILRLPIFPPPPTLPWLGISITNQALGSTHTGSPDPQALADFISDKYFAGLAWCILSQMYSCKQRLTLFTAAVFCGGRNKLRLFPSISNCWVPYRAPALHTGSHGSQGSPIPETKRSLRVVNLIGRGNATQFLDPRLLYPLHWNPIHHGSSDLWCLLCVTRQDEVQIEGCIQMTDSWMNMAH